MKESAARSFDKGEQGRNGNGMNSLSSIRKQHIERALQLANNDLLKTAKLLAVSLRELRRLMRELGIQM